MAREKTEKPEKGKKKKKADKKRGDGNKRRCALYRDRGRREINKLKRILHSNGGDAALTWAKAHENPAKGVFLTPILKSFRKIKPRAFQRAVKNSLAFAKAVGA